MASTKISNMPVATSVSDTDVTPIVQAGANKQATFAVILAYISAAISTVTTFLGLTDTPSSYAGGANKVVSVKADETGLEFTTPSSGAPASAHYVTTQAESGLSAEFNLGGLASGLLKQAVAAGVATPAIATEGTDYLGAARIDDTAYDATTWNGDTTHAPSKNAVRDKFESLTASLSPYVAASSDNTDVAINNTAYQTVLSKAITIAATDTIVIEIWGSLLNNSGGSATYSYQVNVGAVAVFDYSPSANLAAQATSRYAQMVRYIISPSATNVWRAVAQLNHSQGLGAAGIIKAFDPQETWNNGTNDFTGSQTITFKIKSNGNTATQTFTMHAYAIQVIPHT